MKYKNLYLNLNLILLLSALHTYYTTKITVNLVNKLQDSKASTEEDKLLDSKSSIEKAKFLQANNHRRHLDSHRKWKEFFDKVDFKKAAEELKNCKLKK